MYSGTRRATMYWRKCEIRRLSAAVMYVIGVFGCVEVADDGVMLSDICRMVSGRLACLLRSCNDIEGDGSSNRSKTTTLGSALDLEILPALDTVLVLCLESAFLLIFWALAFDTYSGRSAKLFGVTMTLYVPGNVVSAFRSRSSSFVSVANAGRSS